MFAATQKRHGTKLRPPDRTYTVFSRENSWVYSSGGLLDLGLVSDCGSSSSTKGTGSELVSHPGRTLKARSMLIRVVTRIRSRPMYERSLDTVDCASPARFARISWDSLRLRPASATRRGSAQSSSGIPGGRRFGSSAVSSLGLAGKSGSLSVVLGDPVFACAHVCGGA